jgi:hypothetical protein
LDACSFNSRAGKDGSSLEQAMTVKRSLLICLFYNIERVKDRQEDKKAHCCYTKQHQKSSKALQPPFMGVFFKRSGGSS